MSVLLLFDIDGTLVAGATRAHRDAMHEALLTVHGVNVVEGPPRVDRAGRTDGQIARAILVAAGVSALRIDERADAVQEECCRAYARLCPPDLSDTVVPGIPEVLDELSENEDVVLGLLTGNYQAVARLKLTRAGIGHFFAGGPGAFGSDAEDRAALPAIARRRAGTTGRPYPREQTVVIGDTPRDIACARADEVLSVAVTSGPYGASDLRGADAVAENAGELREALASLGA
jgi:phosphoglycolate phosphatase-like HAD superfamily hydrolase